MEFVQAWWAAFWALIFESGLWLIAGFAMAGAMHALVPAGFLARHLAGRGSWPILKASLLGIPLPLCSCSVIPVAAGLRRGGASRGATAAFAISTPQTGEESIPLTWALFGPVYALTRPVIAVVTAFIAGTLIEAVARGDGAVPEPGPAPLGSAAEPSQVQQYQRSRYRSQSTLLSAWRIFRVASPGPSCQGSGNPVADRSGGDASVRIASVGRSSR